MSLATILEELRQDVRELQRRLANIVLPGQISAVDADGHVCRFTHGTLTTGWVRWLTTRAGADRTWWCPSVGEQAVLFAPDGEPNQGWVLPAGFSTAFPAPDRDPARHVVAYDDGMRVIHDSAQKRLVLDGWDAEGTIEFRAKNLILKIGEGGFYHLDLAGMATRTTHLGDNRFKTESWTANTVVTPEANQLFHPPEVEA